MSSTLHIPFKSHYEFKIPITQGNFNIYNMKFDLNFEFDYGFDLLESSGDIEIILEIYNFDNIVYKRDIYKNDVFTSIHKFTDLMYTDTGFSDRFISVKYNFNNRGYHTGSLILKRFNYVIKDYATDNVFLKHSKPELLYSYNSTIKGVIENQDKNAVHVYLNDKFKNVLIVINQNIPFNYDWKSLNNLDMFGENYGIYLSKTKEDLYYELFPMLDSEIVDEGLNIKKYKPEKIVASNYIKTVNNINDIITMDTNIYYHYIDDEGNYASTMMTYFDNTSTFNQLPNWINKFPPFLIKATTSDTLLMYGKSYVVDKYDGPSKNIKDQYIITKDGIPIKDALNNEVFATKITSNPVNKKGGYKNKINRYSGYYEPLVYNIPLFTPTYYWVEEDINNEKRYKSYKGNYKFHTDLEDFGILKEMMYSKVNEDNYILKLKDVNELSLYPILDEVGLSQTSRNIFSSPWDKDYYLKTTPDFIITDNLYSEKIIPNVIIEGGAILNVEVLISGSTYYNGINIYGKTLSDNDKVTYKIDIKNISLTKKSFKCVLKYQSSQKTYIIHTGDIDELIVDDIYTIKIDIDRPEEIRNTLNYEEFTKWYFVVELYDSVTNKLYDFNNKTMFNVYNNIIDFDLLNPTSTIGYNNNQPYYIGSNYDFGITLKETNNKLKNVLYTINLLVENGYNTGKYDTLKTYKDYINRISNEKDIIFSDVLIPINDLDYDNNERRNVKFKVSHSYNIGNEIHLISEIYDGLNILVNRPQEEPKLAYLLIPTLSVSSGSCSGGTYTGDIFTTGVKIVNLGGYFAGNVRVIFNLRENGTTIITRSITEEILLEKGDNTELKFENVVLGPIKGNGEELISYSYKNYDVSISSSYVGGSTRTDYINGINDTTPICN